MAWPADDSPCSTERLHALTEHLNLHPSLIMFDTETVRQFPIPNAQDGGIRVWIEAAMRRSMVYMGSQFFRHVTGVRSESSGLNPARVNTHCSAGHCEYFNILVVLEGHSDTSTALVFEDIAITVKDGLDALGCTARIVYCANLATDSCFAEEEQVLVLAAHNLASYFTPQGTLAVLEGNLLPQDAGEISHQERNVRTVEQVLRYHTFVSPFCPSTLGCGAVFPRIIGCWSNLTLYTPPSLHTPLERFLRGAGTV